MKKRMGRLARAHDPKIKKLKDLGIKLPVPPPSIDWTKGIKSWGMMKNDELGDCTCAAVYHARQIWTLNTGVEKTEPDVDVLKLYEAACGYNPADPNTDQGGIEQNVLKYLLNTGMPLADGTAHKILGFAEVNHKDLNEVKLTIAEFGVAYIGIDVPESIYGANGMPLTIWGYVPDSPVEGGHAIILVGYDSKGFTVISWGGIYHMTFAFFEKYCEEVYAIVDKSWIKSTGKTPLGLSLADLELLMKEIKEN